jgi:hypothetical protein
MIGTSVGLGWNLPDTTVGWVVWVTVKLIVAVLNVMIFVCFMLQAKINISENARYKEAQDILRLNKTEEFIPRSPAEWNRKQYGSKGVTIFITTALSTVALTQAMLTFDWMAMLTYLFTIIMGLIFGVMQMKSAEDYWTEEFWHYAKMVKEEMELAKKESAEQRNAVVHPDRGTDILDTSVDTADSGADLEPVVAISSGSSMCVLGGSSYASCDTSDSFYNES